MKKNAVTLVLLLVLVPLVTVAGVLLFREKGYAWFSLCVAVISCIPLFYVFERKESKAGELAVLAVMVALSVLGRFLFAPIPAFKPVTAITVIAAVYLGKEAGFAVGALSAVISNFYFGQGPWTPFQMFSWGVIGLVAGLLKKPLAKSKILMCIYGFFSGIFYSLTMDVWTTLWADGGFNILRYFASAFSALPVTAVYAASNVVFLLLLSKPVGDKLQRIKTKYGLFAT